MLSWTLRTKSRKCQGLVAKKIYKWCSTFLVHFELDFKEKESDVKLIWDAGFQLLLLKRSFHPSFSWLFFFISMCLIISHLFLLDKVSSSQYEIFLLVFCCCCLYITFTNVCHLLTRVAHVNRRYCPIMFGFSLFVCHLWVYRGRASWEKQQSTCFLAKTWCSAEKWRNLLLRNLLTSGRSASRPALFVAIMEYVQASKDTSIIVLSCAVIVSGASRDA